jgi:enediyne biosynthesis protein E4
MFPCHPTCILQSNLRSVRSAFATASIAIFSAAAGGQEPAKPAADTQAQSGMSTGAPRAAAKDAQMRPITAGGFVDGAPVYFVDVTHQSGLDKFHHRSGEPSKTSILETPGSGVAFLDYDNDGWLDIYLLNGSTVGALKGKEPAPRAMLLHNNHDGTFTDVTDKARILLQRLQGFRDYPLEFAVPPELIIRETTAVANPKRRPQGNLN